MKLEGRVTYIVIRFGMTWHLGRIMVRNAAWAKINCPPALVGMRYLGSWKPKCVMNRLWSSSRAVPHVALAVRGKSGGRNKRRVTIQEPEAWVNECMANEVTGGCEDKGMGQNSLGRKMAY